MSGCFEETGSCGHRETERYLGQGQAKDCCRRTKAQEQTGIDTCIYQGFLLMCYFLLLFLFLFLLKGQLVPQPPSAHVILRNIPASGEDTVAAGSPGAFCLTLSAFLSPIFVIMFLSVQRQTCKEVEAIQLERDFKMREYVY